MDSLILSNRDSLTLPDSVRFVKEFCDSYGIACKLSNNAPAYGCKDAASKRINGSKIGIGLERELKTLLCAYNTSNKREIFAVHMSAARSACFNNIRKSLKLNKKTDIKLAFEDDLKLFDMRLGTVNPFLLAVKTRQRITQIFDSALYNIEDTMFTNAGELIWGIEFQVSDLITSIENRVIFNISKDKNEILTKNDSSRELL